MQRPEAANQRIILSPETAISFLDLGTLLDKGLKNSGYDYKIKLRSVSNWLLGIVSWFNSEAKSTLPFTKRPNHTFDNSRSRVILGIEYKRTPAELVLETALSLI